MVVIAIAIAMHCYGQDISDYQINEDDKEPPDEDELDQDLELKGVDRPPVVRELHEESVVLLEPLRVGQGGGRLNKSMYCQQQQQQEIINNNNKQKVIAALPSRWLT